MEVINGLPIIVSDMASKCARILASSQNRIPRFCNFEEGDLGIRHPPELGPLKRRKNDWRVLSDSLVSEQHG